MLTARLNPSLERLCALRVSRDVLPSVTFAESHQRELAIHDNVTQETFEPQSKHDPERIAARLISEGYKPDMGSCKSPPQIFHAPVYQGRGHSIPVSRCGSPHRSSSSIAVAEPRSAMKGPCADWRFTPSR